MGICYTLCMADLSGELDERKKQLEHIAKQRKDQMEKERTDRRTRRQEEAQKLKRQQKETVEQELTARERVAASHAYQKDSREQRHQLELEKQRKREEQAKLELEKKKQEEKEEKERAQLKKLHTDSLSKYIREQTEVLKEEEHMEKHSLEAGRLRELVELDQTHAGKLHSLGATFKKESNAILAEEQRHKLMAEEKRRFAKSEAMKRFRSATMKSIGSAKDTYEQARMEDSRERSRIELQYKREIADAEKMREQKLSVAHATHERLWAEAERNMQAKRLEITSRYQHFISQIEQAFENRRKMLFSSHGLKGGAS